MGACFSKCMKEPQPLITLADIEMVGCDHSHDLPFLQNKIDLKT